MDGWMDEWMNGWMTWMDGKKSSSIDKSEGWMVEQITSNIKFQQIDKPLIY